MLRTLQNYHNHQQSPMLPWNALRREGQEVVTEGDHPLLKVPTNVFHLMGPNLYDQALLAYTTEELPPSPNPRSPRNLMYPGSMDHLVSSPIPRTTITYPSRIWRFGSQDL